MDEQKTLEELIAEEDRNADKWFTENEDGTFTEIPIPAGWVPEKK